MTTKTELAEILLESDRTGRKVQERNVVNDTNWYYYDGNGFMLNEYEYRLEPKKKVKHEGYIIKGLLDLAINNPNSLSRMLGSNDWVKVTWETE